MLVPADTFPLRDLTESEANIVKDFLGRPEPEHQMLKSFIEFGGKPLLTSNYDLLRYMGSAKSNLLEFLDIHDPNAARAFTATALVYTGTYQHVTRAQDLPIEPHALVRAGSLEPRDLLLASRDIFEKYPNFRDLLGVVLPSLGIVDPKMAEIANVGAGAVHMAILEAAEPADTTMWDAFEEDFATRTTDIDKEYRRLTGGFGNE